jgi:Dioxygenase
MIRTALMSRRTDQVPSLSSPRTMDAPSTMAFILPNATALGRYFNHPADSGSVESTVQRPFYWEGAPDLPRGSNLAEGVKGEPTFYSGRVLGEDGRPLENALLDIWSGDGEGNYDMQIMGEKGVVAGSEYLDSDAVFGMKESLVAQFERHPPGIVPGGERIDTPFYTVNYDFRLRATTAAVERNV